MQAPQRERPHIEVLDGWRGLAITLVLVGHFFPIPGLNLARLGVDFFFALSGRLMAQMLFERELPLPLFFYRRVSRVYPAMAVFVLASAWTFRSTLIKVGPLAIVSALTFATNYVSIYAHRSGLFDHIWSLCVEEHTYLMLGALAFAARRFQAPVAPLLLVAALAAIANGVIQTDILGLDYFDVFWRSDVQCGSILASAFLFLTRSHWLGARAAAASPLFAVLAVLLKSAFLPTILRFGLGSFAVGLAVGALEEAPNWFQRGLCWPPLRGLGLLSFSLYLWQQPFFELHERGYGIWTFVVAITMGVVSFFTVEAPTRRWLNARFRST